MFLVSQSSMYNCTNLWTVTLSWVSFYSLLCERYQTPRQSDRDRKDDTTHQESQACHQELSGGGSPGGLQTVLHRGGGKLAPGIQDEHQHEVSHPLSDTASPAGHTLSVFILPCLPPGTVLHPSSHHVWLLHRFLVVHAVTLCFIKIVYKWSISCKWNPLKVKGVVTLEFSK